MRSLRRLSVWFCVLSLAAPGAARAQGRGGGVWTTSHNDAQRTSSVRTDPRISRQSLSKPGFQLLWKHALEPPATPRPALTAPVFSTPGFITYKGFKALAYIGGGSETVYALDYDLNKMFWTAHLSTASAPAGTAACPGGLTSLTENTPLAPAQPGGGRGGGPGGRGANPVYAVSSGGMIHFLNAQTGADLTAPVRVLPAANAKVVGSIVVNNTFYAATADNCGGVPNGVYAMDLTPAPMPPPPPAAGPMPPSPAVTPASTAVVSWTTNGGSIAGSAGPALGTDGTVYVATADGDYSATAFSDAVVSLDARTLKQKDYFTPGKTPFTSSPVVFQYKGKDVIVAGNQDGRLYLLDSASLGGADHKTPLFSTPPIPGSAGGIAGVSTFEESGGARWLVAASGVVTGFKIVDADGAITLQPAWSSDPNVSLLTPTIMNGVVFAVSSGEPQGQRGQGNAVLHALDLTTGRELWTSGSAIASPVRGIGPVANDSQVYVVSADGILYTFGFPTER
jgi:outer membrane protein assembly factor BamB